MCTHGKCVHICQLGKCVHVCQQLWCTHPSTVQTQHVNSPTVRQSIESGGAWECYRGVRKLDGEGGATNRTKSRRGLVPDSFFVFGSWVGVGGVMVGGRRGYMYRRVGEFDEEGGSPQNQKWRGLAPDSTVYISLLWGWWEGGGYMYRGVSELDEEGGSPAEEARAGVGWTSVFWV